MKTVVITGAATGMGQSMTQLFYDKGWNVVLADLDSEKSIAAIQEIQQTDRDNQLLAVQTNVADPESVQHLVAEVTKHFDHVDALVNNAGIFVQGRVDEVSPETWNKVIAVDLNGVYLMSKYFAPQMMKRHAGSIVNIASVSGLLGDYHFTPYSAAKGAVVNLVRSLALDYGKYGIRVNNVCPGATATAMFKQNPVEI